MSSSHDITLTPQEQALIMRLKSFRVPEMAHILEEQLKDPNADLNTFMERMTAMVDAEWQARADKRFNRLMKEAHLRYPAADQPVILITDPYLRHCSLKNCRLPFIGIQYRIVVGIILKVVIIWNFKPANKKSRLN